MDYRVWPCCAGCQVSCRQESQARFLLSWSFCTEVGARQRTRDHSSARAAGQRRAWTTVLQARWTTRRGSAGLTAESVNQVQGWEGQSRLREGSGLRSWSGGEQGLLEELKGGLCGEREGGREGEVSGECGGGDTGQRGRLYRVTWPAAQTCDSLVAVGWLPSFQGSGQREEQGFPAPLLNEASLPRGPGTGLPHRPHWAALGHLLLH